MDHVISAADAPRLLDEEDSRPNMKLDEHKQTHTHTLNFSLDLLEPRVAYTCWQTLLIVFIIIIIHHTVPPVSLRRHPAPARQKPSVSQKLCQTEQDRNQLLKKQLTKLKESASDQIIAVVSKIELFIHWPINIC